MDLLLVLFKRHTCSISLHTSVKCAVRSPDMIKLTSHFNELCSQFDHLNFCEQMWIYSWCSSRDIHVQTHCTLQLSVQWGHQTWSNSLHTSMNCAVSLITWIFVSRCGSTFVALQETYMFKLTAHLRSLCSEFGHSKFCEQMWIYFWGPSRDRHGQTHCTLQFSVQ